jgi:DNA repair exonuclease SbcCD ATPase subunit
MASVSTSCGTQGDVASSEKASSPASESSIQDEHQPVTPDFAVSEQMEAGAGCSPDISSPDTKRCLVMQLGEAEVFHITTDSDEESHSPAKNVQLAGSDSEAISLQSTATHSQQCTGHTEAERSELQADAWMEDDWVNPPRSMQINLSTLATGLEGPSCQVSDAALNDLRLEVQSQVQHAVNQMHSWISEEILFARQALQDDVRQSCESWTSKHEDLQQAHAQLGGQVEELKDSLVEQLQALQNAEQNTSGLTRPRASTEPQPSASVLEARNLAEERKWRTTLERIQSLEKQVASITEKTTAQDADIAGITSSEHGLQAQISKVKVALEENISRFSGKLDKIGKDTNELAARVTIQATEVRNSCALAENMQAALEKGMQGFAEKSATQENCLNAHATDLRDMEQKITNRTEELASKIDAQDSSIHGCIHRIDEIEAIDKDIHNKIESTTEQSRLHSTSIKEISAHVSELESKLHSDVDTVNEKVTAADMLVKDGRDQLFELEGKLAREAKELAIQFRVHDSSIQVCVDQICNLEAKIDEEVRASSERSHAQDARVTESAALIQELESRFHDKAKSFLDTAEANSNGLVARLVDLEAEVAQQTSDFLSKVQEHDGNMKNWTDQIHCLEDRLQDQGKMLTDMSSAHYDNVKDTSARIHSMEQRLEDEESAIAQKINATEAKAKDSCSRISELENALAKEGEGLSAKFGAYEVRVQKDILKCLTQIRDLDGRLSNEAKMLAEKLASHEAISEENVSHLLRLKENVEKKTSMLSDKVQSQLQSVQAECSRVSSGLQVKSGSLKQLQKQFSRHESSIRENGNAIQKIEVQASQHKQDLLKETETLLQIKSNLNKSHKERLAELEVVCSKLEEHEAQLTSLPSRFRAQMVSSEEGLVRSMTDLSNDLRQANSELSKELSTKASLAEMRQAQSTTRNWIEESLHSYQVMAEDMASSLGKAAASNAEQDVRLERHESWMKEASTFLHQEEERSRGFSNILFRIVDQDYAELTSLFQETLTATQ